MLITYCFLGCNFRHRADAINQQFIYELKKYIPRPEMADIYKTVIQQAWNSKTVYLYDDRKQLVKQIKELEEKLSYIRELLASRKIEPEDFRDMKSDYSEKMEKIEANP